MAVIITDHIAHSRSRCGASQRAVIIHALAPVIGPYMSRAITTTHSQADTAVRARIDTSAARPSRRACSTRVSGRSAGRAGLVCALGVGPGERRVLSIVPAADVLPRQTEGLHA